MPLATGTLGHRRRRRLRVPPTADTTVRRPGWHFGDIQKISVGIQNRYLATKCHGVKCWIESGGSGSDEIKYRGRLNWDAKRYGFARMVRTDQPKRSKYGFYHGGGWRDRRLGAGGREQRDDLGDLRPFAAVDFGQNRCSVFPKLK